MYIMGEHPCYSFFMSAFGFFDASLGFQFFGHADSVLQSEEKLQELVSRLDLFRKPPPVRRSSQRSSMVADVPILAKL